MGFHINPVDDKTPEMLKKIDELPKGIPVSLHGRPGNHLPDSVMRALKDKGVPFVRLASPDGDAKGTKDSPPLVATFGAGNTVEQLQSSRYNSINHYFFHANEFNKVKNINNVLTYLNKNAK
jgi:hypothetical protein